MPLTPKSKRIVLLEVIVMMLLLFVILPRPRVICVRQDIHQHGGASDIS